MCVYIYVYIYICVYICIYVYVTYRKYVYDQGKHGEWHGKEIGKVEWELGT